ncbi:hypothetical protein ACJX0J_024873, partial [Zea mays]
KKYLILDDLLYLILCHAVLGNKQVLLSVLHYADPKDSIMKASLCSYPQNLGKYVGQHIISEVIKL